MKVYIVFDRETGDVVHKFRMVHAAEVDSEDTVECDAEDVLSLGRRFRQSSWKIWSNARCTKEE